MKNILYITLLAGLAVLGLTACGDSSNNANSNKSGVNTAVNTAANAVNTAVNTAGNAVNTVANTVANATRPNPDDFLKTAAEGGAGEIELSKVAVAKTQNAEVKKFAQMMIDDHTKVAAEVKALASKKTVTLPTDIGPNKPILEKLNGLSGLDGDKYYMAHMVDDHESTVSAFEKQATGATDAEVKAFAAKTLPSLKKHLEAAKALQAKLK